MTRLRNTAGAALLICSIGTAAGTTIHTKSPASARPIHAKCYEDQACYPLGVRLQATAGSAFEVIYDPRTGVYSVEPNDCTTDSECEAGR